MGVRGGKWLSQGCVGSVMVARGRAGCAVRRVLLGRLVGPWVQVMDPLVYHPR
jgi:hypothetical protein